MLAVCCFSFGIKLSTSVFLASYEIIGFLNQDFSTDSGIQGYFLYLRGHLVHVIELARAGPGSPFLAL